MCWTLRINAGVSWAGKWGKVVLEEMLKIAMPPSVILLKKILVDKKSEVVFVWPIEMGLWCVEKVGQFKVKNTGRWSEKLSTESVDIISLIMFEIANSMINPGEGLVIITSVCEWDIGTYITSDKIKSLHEALKDSAIRADFSKINVKIAHNYRKYGSSELRENLLIHQWFFEKAVVDSLVFACLVIGRQICAW